jgi:hypothetical protein
MKFTYVGKVWALSRSEGTPGFLFGAQRKYRFVLGAGASGLIDEWTRNQWRNQSRRRRSATGEAARWLYGRHIRERARFVSSGLDGIEVGAEWKKTARESGNADLSVKLDSPFLPKPVNCALMPQDDGSHILVWSRDDRRQAWPPGPLRVVQGGPFLSPQEGEEEQSIAARMWWSLFWTTDLITKILQP